MIELWPTARLGFGLTSAPAEFDSGNQVCLGFVAAIARAREYVRTRREIGKQADVVRVLVGFLRARIWEDPDQLAEKYFDRAREFLRGLRPEPVANDATAAIVAASCVVSAGTQTDAERDRQLAAIEELSRSQPPKPQAVWIPGLTGPTEEAE